MPYDIVEKHHHPKYPRLALLLTTASKNWLARTYLNGRLRYKSTSTPSLTTAFRIGAEWYAEEVRAAQAEEKRHPDQPKSQWAMSAMFESFVGTLNPRKAAEATRQWGPIKGFWAHHDIRRVSPKVFRQFYAKRREHDIGNHTLHKDITLVRQILKHAAEEELIEHLPFIPRIGKIAHNPRKWLTPEEWKHLQAVSRQRIKDAENIRTKKQRQDCHDFMTFMVHSMMRVDEVRHLTFGDCVLGKNKQGHDILIVNVRVSKTGPRPNVVCLVGAAAVFKRRQTPQTKPTDRIFSTLTRDAFRSLLTAANLYEDGNGNTRNLKALRATGISFRILDGANVVLIANNSGTSINSISNFYAKYLRGTDDVDALTTIKPLRRKP